MQLEEKESPCNLIILCVLGKLGETNSKKSKQHVHRTQYSTSTKGNILLTFYCQTGIFWKLSLVLHTCNVVFILHMVIKS